MRKIAALLLFVPVISFSQNVGIGTTNPQAKLEVRNPVKSVVKVRSEGFNDTTQLVLSNRNASEQGTDFILSNNRETGLRLVSSSDIPSYNNDSILLLTQDGRMGIGNTSPAEKLDVRGSINIRGGSIKVNGTDGSAGQVLMKNSSGNLVWGDMNPGYQNFVIVRTTGAGTWPVPAGVTRIMIEAWGGGGGGNGGAGGGGGGYVAGYINVTAGAIVNYNVGAGGPGDDVGEPDGTNGQPTTVTIAGATFTATGGERGDHITGPTNRGGIGGIGSATGTANYIFYRGESGQCFAYTYMQKDATTYLQVGTAGKGGDAPLVQTGGPGTSYLYDLTASNMIQRRERTGAGTQPGGGGSSGYSWPGFSVTGADGGNGMIIIRY